MRLKHVLFGGLFLTVGFAACTNDDFTEVQNPSVSAENALSLGEGYTITAASVADPATKSIFEVADGALMPYWESDDVIGARQYGVLGESNFKDGAIIGTPGAANGTYNFGTNIGFNWLEQVGDKYHARFQATNNVMAGSYVLYYPFDKSITMMSDEITVERNFENVTYNCAEGKEFEGINDRMFSYGEAAFMGGVETGNFTLRQVPVVFRLNFGAENLQLVTGQKLTIDRVILEAYSDYTTDSDNKIVIDKTKSVLATKGTVTAPDVPSAADFNSYLAYLAGDEDGKPLPKAKYESSDADDSKVGHYTIVVEGGDNADYQIDGLNKATEGSIIFSALPFTAEAKLVIVKIVTDQGIVLSKEYTKAADLKVFNAATEEGALVKTTVMVDTQTQDNTIYTVGQFNTQWEAALKAGKGTLTIADPILLEDVTLTSETANANITIQSEDNATLSIAGINMQKGTLNITSDVKIGGDIVTTGDSELNITGKVAAKNITLSGDATINEVTEMTSLTIGQSGVVALTLPSEKAKVGKITINQGGQLTLNGGAINGYENNGGKLTLAGAVTNYGEFEGAVATTGSGIFKNAKGATATFNVPTGAQSAPAINFENEEGATINIEAEDMDDRFALNGTNNGTINVKKAQLTENAAGELKVGAKGVVNVNETGFVALNNESAISGWIIFKNKDTKYQAGLSAGAYAEKAAYSVTKTEDIADVLENIHKVFVDGDLNIKEDLPVNHYLYIRVNQTLSDGATLSTNCPAYIEGDITLNGKGTLKVSNSNNAPMSINGSLTLGNDVKVVADIMSNADYYGKITCKDLATQVTVTTKN